MRQIVYGNVSVTSEDNDDFNKLLEVIEKLLQFDEKYKESRVLPEVIEVTK